VLFNSLLWLREWLSWGSLPAVRDLVLEGGAAFAIERRAEIYRLTLASLANGYRHRRVLGRAGLDAARRFPLEKRLKQPAPPSLPGLGPEELRSVPEADLKALETAIDAHLAPRGALLAKLEIAYLASLARGEDARIHRNLLRRAVRKLRDAGSGAGVPGERLLRPDPPRPTRSREAHAHDRASHPRGARPGSERNPSEANAAGYSGVVMQSRRALALALVLLWSAAACGGNAAPERIVLILVDTLRRDHLSVYGATLKTPTAERLAARGRALEASASFHQTTMSMGALFTGHTPSLESGDSAEPLAWSGNTWCGLARLADGPGDDACLPGGLATLGEVMRRGDYWTLGVVANPLLFRPAGFERGFDTWIEIGEPRRPSAKLSFRDAASLRAAEHVNAAVFEALPKRPGDRVFLYVHYMDVHDWHMLKRSYAESVERLDAALGALLDHLDAQGLLDAAVVVLASDHGETLQEPHVVKGLPMHAGNPSFEELLRVPLVVAGTDLADPPFPLRSEDLFHWLARLAGAEAPRETTLDDDELLVTERFYRTYRRGRFKSYWRRPDGRFILVDLDADPGEQRDVAAAHPDVAAAHRERVETLTRRLAAPEARAGKIGEVELERLRLLGYLK
jgi:arylsulfatase A-like enzyme